LKQNAVSDRWYAGWTINCRYTHALNQAKGSAAGASSVPNWRETIEAASSFG
jgi:hypothetical protein